MWLLRHIAAWWAISGTALFENEEHLRPMACCHTQALNTKNLTPVKRMVSGQCSLLTGVKSLSGRQVHHRR